MKKHAWLQLFGKFGFYLNLFLATALILVYLSVYIPPDRFSYAAFAGLLYPWLLALNLIFLILYALLKSPKALLSLAAILVGFNVLARFVQIIPSFGGNEQGIRILSYNVHHFSRDRNNGKSGSSILEYLRSERADILCLQETRLYRNGTLSPEKIRDILPGIRHYQMAHSASFAGPMTLSRFPIIRMGEIRFEHSANMVLFSDVLIRAGDTVRVYNCHMQSYRITPEDYSLTDSGRSGSNEQQLQEARQISQKMRLAFAIRARQARTVAAHIRKCRFPVIVCGDFNDTPVSYTYRIIGKSLNDAFRESGFGVSNTYNGVFPLLRIDYVLYSQRFKAVDYKRGRVNFSDHFPVTAVLEELR
ncbi:MAG: endonuclease/exonuclease/phosphatase family protein [Marinilabiliales bacterium]|nr:endonuclease/exonuclease/phosphatase family protein [Marinilabiliales bacterium]